MKSVYKHYSQWPHALPQEVAIAVEVNGINYAVMMASPFDLEDFALGFLYTEQVIKAPHDLHNIELITTEQGISLQVQIANRRVPQLQTKLRHVRGTSGCGICGVAALEHVFGDLKKLPSNESFTDGLPNNLKQRCFDFQQQTKAKTTQASEAVHAAFWLTASNEIELCREDIGRHNAVDKLIGALLKNKTNLQIGALVVTSRCSVELVQKAIIAKIATLISFASPSTLAVKMALAHNLQLIHIPKTDIPILYTHKLLSSPCEKSP